MLPAAGVAKNPAQILAPKRIARCYAADQGFAENKTRSLGYRQSEIFEICVAVDGQ